MSTQMHSNTLQQPHCTTIRANLTKSLVTIHEVVQSFKKKHDCPILYQKQTNKCLVTCKTKNITNQSQVLNWKLHFQPNVTIKTYFSFNIIKYRLKKRGGLLPHKVWAYTSVCVCVCINCSINTMLSLTNKHFWSPVSYPQNSDGSSWVSPQCLSEFSYWIFWICEIICPLSLE